MKCTRVKEQIALLRFEFRDKKDPSRNPWLKREICDLYYSDDTLNKLTNLTYYMRKKLKDKFNVETIHDLHTTYITGTVKFVQNVQNARIETANYNRGLRSQVPIRNYLNDDNPYELRFGPNWMDYAQKGPILRKNVCITDIIDYIFNETKKVFVGTKYEDNFLIYHDALSQLGEKEAYEYIISKGYDKHWLSPLLGINAGTTWAHRPTGNSPEFMPLDRNLFRDFHCTVEAMIAATCAQPKDAEEKYSSNSVKNLEKVYIDAWEVAPSVERIIEDCSKVTKVYKLIYKNYGAL